MSKIDDTKLGLPKSVDLDKISIKLENINRFDVNFYNYYGIQNYLNKKIFINYDKTKPLTVSCKDVVFKDYTSKYNYFDTSEYNYIELDCTSNSELLINIFRCILNFEQIKFYNIKTPLELYSYKKPYLCLTVLLPMTKRTNIKTKEYIETSFFGLKKTVKQYTVDVHTYELMDRCTIYDKDGTKFYSDPLYPLKNIEYKNKLVDITFTIQDIIKTSYSYVIRCYLDTLRFKE